MGSERKTGGLRNWLFVAAIMTLGSAIGWVSAMHTADQWYVAPVDHEKLALQATVAKMCRPMPIRLIKCGNRDDACLCQPVGPETRDSIEQLNIDIDAINIK